MIYGVVDDVVKEEEYELKWMGFEWRHVIKVYYYYIKLRGTELYFYLKDKISCQVNNESELTKVNKGEAVIIMCKNDGALGFVNCKVLDSQFNYGLTQQYKAYLRQQRDNLL